MRLGIDLGPEAGQAALRIILQTIELSSASTVCVDQVFELLLAPAIGWTWAGALLALVHLRSSGAVTMGVGELRSRLRVKLSARVRALEPPIVRQQEDRDIGRERQRDLTRQYRVQIEGKRPVVFPLRNPLRRARYLGALVPCAVAGCVVLGP